MALSYTIFFKNTKDKNFRRHGGRLRRQSWAEKMPYNVSVATPPRKGLSRYIPVMCRLPVLHYLIIYFLFLHIKNTIDPIFHNSIFSYSLFNFSIISSLSKNGGVNVPFLTKIFFTNQSVLLIIPLI